MTRKLKVVLVMIAGAFAVSACLPNGMRFPQTSGFFQEDRYQSNGERIYFSASSESGSRIRPLSGPTIGMMMGATTCSSCHGDDGRGGNHFMHMELMDAPDIRWETLSGEEHGEHGEETEEAQPYTADAFKLAVREGMAPGDQRLSRDMPRWDISDEDLADLMEYLETLK
jgi:cytochrome c oxidase subunit II